VSPSGPSHDLLQEASSIGELLTKAARLADCVAVTTAGQALTVGSLRPQHAWRARSDWGEGVYVRPAVAQRLGLRPPPVLTPGQRGVRVCDRWRLRGLLLL